MPKTTTVSIRMKKTVTTEDEASAFYDLVKTKFTNEPDIKLSCTLRTQYDPTITNLE